jgi:hypothetical protein
VVWEKKILWSVKLTQQLSFLKPYPVPYIALSFNLACPGMPLPQPMPASLLLTHLRGNSRKIAPMKLRRTMTILTDKTQVFHDQIEVKQK